MKKKLLIKAKINKVAFLFGQVYKEPADLEDILFPKKKVRKIKVPEVDKEIKKLKKKWSKWK